MGKIVMNKQLDRLLKEALMAYFKAISQHFSGGIEKPQNTFIQLVLRSRIKVEIPCIWSTNQ
jgi:hypothetical protein